MDKHKPSDSSRLPPKLPPQKVSVDIDGVDSQLHDEGWRTAPKEKTIEGEIKPVYTLNRLKIFPTSFFL